MSNILFQERGTAITLANKLNQPVSYDKLPVGTYEVSANPEIGFYLTKVKGFDIPKKLYGNTPTRAARFLNTFKDRKGTTGVLLSGLKGSGKSLEMKLTATMGLAMGYPVIIINSAWCGPAFNQFIASIGQPIILVFDEFEKVYNAKEQEALLTLLDGTFTTQMLVMFTSNNKYKVDTHMMNRPGRIFYAIDFAGLEKQFVEEYCQDKLERKELIRDILRVTAFIRDFNFDMLQALVEELNRYKTESVKDALTILNITFDADSDSRYTVHLYNKRGTQIPGPSPSTVQNPLQSEYFYFEYRQYDSKAKKYKDEYEEVEINEVDPEKLVVSDDLCRIELTHDKGKVVFVKPRQRQVYDPMKRF